MPEATTAASQRQTKPSQNRAGQKHSRLFLCCSPVPPILPTGHLPSLLDDIPLFLATACRCPPPSPVNTLSSRPSRCRSSAPSARRRPRVRQTPLATSPRTSLSTHPRKTAFPIFDFRRLASTWPSLRGTRRSASTRSTSRAKVKEKRCLSMKLPS